jgi:acetyl esterase/lipase
MAVNETSSHEGLTDGQAIDLWPGMPPGSQTSRATPTVIERSPTLFRPDRALTGIIKPSLTAVLPDQPNGVSMIVAPGGSYARIVLDKEGYEVAKWLCGLGITVFLLAYRLPAEGHQNGPDVPVQDGQRAVRLVREHAAGWGLDPARIGFLGFSAAGHLGASLVASPDKKLVAPNDGIDRHSARPDFAVLAYPVVSMATGVAHPDSRTNLLGENPPPDLIEAHSPDRHVTPVAPPVFIVAADDDAVVPAENSVRFYMALKKAGVAAELHIYKDGGHGFSLEHAPGLPVSRWPRLCEDWLGRIGVLTA